MSSKLDAGGGVEKFSIDELAGGGRSIEVAGRGRSGRMKVARCGWGRTGAGEVDAGMPVSRCTVSLNSMVLASSTVVGTRFVARERRFEGFVGPRARDDDTRDGSGAGDCSAEVEGGSDVRHVWSVSTSEKREGLAGASTGAVRCIASWLLCELDDGNGELWIGDACWLLDALADSHDQSAMIAAGDSSTSNQMEETSLPPNGVKSAPLRRLVAFSTPTTPWWSLSLYVWACAVMTEDSDLSKTENYEEDMHIHLSTHM
jgi:hypothetical protein